MKRIIETIIEVEHDYHLRKVAVTFAWFNTLNVPNVSVEQILENGEYPNVPIESTYIGKEVIAQKFLDQLINNIELNNLHLNMAVEHRRAIDFLLAENIIIERSPPEYISLSSALARASSVVVGTYLGQMSAGNDPQLMFITIPAGILVVGSVLGVARGLEEGLHKSIARLVERKIR